MRKKDKKEKKNEAEESTLVELGRVAGGFGERHIVGGECYESQLQAPEPAEPEEPQQ
jgi:hypothetical protein